MNPDDAMRLGIDDGEVVLITSRRGSIQAPVRDSTPTCGPDWPS